MTINVSKLIVGLVAVLILAAVAIVGFQWGRRTPAANVVAPDTRPQAPSNPAAAAPATARRTTRNGIPLLSPAEVNALRTRPDVLIIDVRGDFTWAQGHVPGAISFPEGQAEQRYSELPRDKLIIAY